VNGAGPIVERFFALQRRMYTGGPVEPLESLLADDVTWHVPGRSAIAGDYVGRRAVMEYFRRRRALTGATLEIVDRGGIAVDDTVVRLADGRATIVVSRCPGGPRASTGSKAGASGRPGWSRSTWSSSSWPGRAPVDRRRSWSGAAQDRSRDHVGRKPDSDCSSRTNHGR